MNAYEYVVGEGSLASGLASSKLHSEIAASAISAVFSHLVVEGGSCWVHTNSPLTVGEKDALDAVVAAHDGTPLLQVRFHGASTIAHGEVGVTESDWALVGGVVTTPDFFAPVASLRARVTGSFKTVGTSAELRLVEDGTTVLGSFELPDTAGAWEKMQWHTSAAASEGTHEYTLEARLGSATSASVRYVSMSVLEFYS